MSQKNLGEKLSKKLQLRTVSGITLYCRFRDPMNNVRRTGSLLLVSNRESKIASDGKRLFLMPTKLRASHQDSGKTSEQWHES